MKIAIVGPTHPYKGGIALHTTELAHRLQQARHQVELISWKTQYPFFYPGDQFVPDDKPELPVFPNTTRALSWKNPAGWVGWARRMRKFDRVIFIWWVPTIQGPVYLSMLKAMGQKRPPVSLICHNILPHEPRKGDKQIAKTLFKRIDQLVVHTEAQAKLARSLTTTEVRVAALPGHMLNRLAVSRNFKLHKRLLFFGLVRPYKGVDVLIRALAKTPGVQLTIAGEMWGKQQAALETLITKLDLGDRVTLRPGYAPSAELPELFDSSDALVLPYRAGTATQNTDLAFSFGVPVIASSVGSMPQQLRDGVDGLLCQPDDVESLAHTLKHFYEPGIAKKLRQAVPKLSTDEDWQAYVATLT